jgi:hypothetical protein
MSYTPTQLGQQLINNIKMVEYRNLEKLLLDNNDIVLIDSNELKAIEYLKLTNTGLNLDGTRFYTFKPEYFTWSK